MSDETRDTRLPPPAFPPGSRKHEHTNSDSPSGAPASSSGSPDVTLISPDDPMPERRPDAVLGAFISPDDPMPVRAEREEGVVTGMGSDPHMDPEELVTGGDPYVIELIGTVGRLAEALKRKGEAGLRASPQMTRFEATLRSYCVGYLARRRAEDEVERGEYRLDMGRDSKGE